MRLVSYGGDDLEEDEDENESSEESQDEDSDRKDNNDTVSIRAIFPVLVQHFMSAVYVLQMFDKILEEHTTYLKAVSGTVKVTSTVFQHQTFSQFLCTKNVH